MMERERGKKKMNKNEDEGRRGWGKKKIGKEEDEENEKMREEGDRGRRR